MEPFGALSKEGLEAKSLKRMVGPCGLEPQTSTVSTRGLPKYAEVVQDIALCGLGCGLEIIKEASPFCNFYNTNKPLMLWICTTPIKVFTLKRTRQPNVPSPQHTGISSSPGQ